MVVEFLFMTKSQPHRCYLVLSVVLLIIILLSPFNTFTSNDGKVTTLSYSPEWSKGCIRFWGRLDQNSGFHGNRKLPLAYNGENDVSIFSRLFLIQSFLYLQVTKTCIKSRTISNFGQIGPLTTKLAALEHLKIFPQTYNGKMVSPC